MSELQISRPERWAIPFSEQMTDENVRSLLQMRLFSEDKIAPEHFSTKVPLEGILKNDSRLLNCTNGEIIVREGDWGNSAFFLLSGSVRIEIGGGQNGIPPVMLGRSPVRRKSFFEALKQLWRRPRDVEVRDLSTYTSDAEFGNTGAGTETRVFLQDFSKVVDRYKTTKMTAIEFFGEQSALGRIERTATVFADGDCTLLEVRWQGIRDIMNRVPWLRERVDERFRSYGLRAFLRQSPYFSHLEERPEAMSETKKRVALLSQRVLKGAEFASYGSYDKVDRFTKVVQSGNASNLAHETLIAAEGDYPYGVILVRSGIVRVSHKHNNGHKTVSYLTPGQAFGVDEIVNGWKTGSAVELQYSARAVGYATVIVIPTEVFEVTVLEELLKGGMENLADTALFSPQHDVTSQQMDPGLMEFLVERRLVNGTATMIIDMDRCTRCDDCVRACAAAHDNSPRFLRHGPIYGKYMVANACMHCADPVCMIQCPTGAIHRTVQGGEVVINDSTCVGCTACANNCPYDAIRMVQIRDTDGHPVYPTHVSRTDESGNETSQPIAPTMKEWEPIVKATKCDLCADQTTGPACQHACPHDALTRVNLGNYDTALNWLKP